MGYPKSRIVNFMGNPFIHGWEPGVPPFQEPWFDGKTSDGAIVGPLWYLFILTMRMDMRNVSTFCSFVSSVPGKQINHVYDIVRHLFLCAFVQAAAAPSVRAFFLS